VSRPEEILMTVRRARRWGWIVLAVLTLLVVGALVGFRVAVGVLRDRVLEALGPASEIAAIEVGWSSLDLQRVRIPGPPHWPARDALRAERITIVPSLRGALSGQLRVWSITVHQPYLSALRTRSGQLEILPGLLTGRHETEPPAEPAQPAPATRPVTIDQITLHDGVLELFDASVATPPLEIHLMQLEASVLDVVVPALTGKTRFDLAAVLDGAQQDGTLTITGWAEITSRDSSLKTTLRSAELAALEPYFIRAGERGVRKGTLDLDLQSEVSGNRLHAPGQLTISGLELAPANDAFGSFMGLPRDAVVGVLKNERKEISVSFVLDGNLDDPQFSLNEAFTTRLASALAETLGVSLGGLATGVGSLGVKGVEAVGEAAKDAVQQIFQGEKKGQR
jgi:hypothetical protein